MAAQPRLARFGAFEANLSSCELRKHGLRLKIQDQPFQILTTLLERPGELVTREELHKKLWPDGTFVDFDAGLNAAMRRLRDVLNDSSEKPQYIETLPRHGYRFIAEIHFEQPRSLALPARSAPYEVVSAPAPARTIEQQEERQESRRGWLRWAVACAVAVLIAMAIVAGRKTVTAVHRADGIHSIAVLPLQNLSGDTSQDYFADGMTDALITDLARSKSLRVISSTSSMRYRATNKTLPEIARELNVDAVVEGAVVRFGDEVRVDAQLIRAKDDQHIWANTYKRKMRDVLALQNDVTEAIVKEIEIELHPEQRPFSQAQHHPVDPKAYEEYLKGRYFSDRGSVQSDFDRAVGHFQEAIREDPEYAPAYAGLSDVYSIMGAHWANIDHPEQLALDAARKAVALDDTLADAHLSLGFVLHRHMQDWAGAETEFKRALELDPNSSWAHYRYGFYFNTVAKRQQACDEFRIAHELDPLNGTLDGSFADCLLDLGQFAHAVQIEKDAIEMEPNEARFRWDLGQLFEKKAMYPEALREYEKGAELSGRNSIFLCLMASAYAGSGESQKAEELLQEMHRKDGVDSWLDAAVHARMGKKELAIREITSDLNENCGPGKCGPGASLFIWEWRFAPLRSDPRFQKLLALYNYPESARQK